jgi:aspartate-semialdehyde dehydrogenase
MATKEKIGIIGATGAVGEEMIRVLHERNYPLSSLHLFASQRSAGKEIETPFGKLVVELFSVEAARKMDVVFMAVSGTFAEENAPKIAAPGGAVVIDNSSAFRYDDRYPLVVRKTITLATFDSALLQVPEINGWTAKGKTLIANPNCTTAIAVMALWPLHLKFGIKKLICSTYQAASGAGVEGMNELREGTKVVLEGGVPGEYASVIHFHKHITAGSLQRPRHSLARCHLTLYHISTSSSPTVSQKKR